jgi:hypothetical protein
VDVNLQRNPHKCLEKLYNSIVFIHARHSREKKKNSKKAHISVPFWNVSFFFERHPSFPREKETP